MLLPLALGATALYLFLASKSGGNSGSSIPASRVDRSLGDAISAAIMSPNLAEKMRVHDLIVQSPQGKEPQMENARLMLANQLTQATATPAKGPVTGRDYRLKLVSLFSDGVRMYEVFTSSGSKILRFREEMDGSNRKFLDNPPGVDGSILLSARRDFGLGTPS